MNPDNQPNYTTIRRDAPSDTASFSCLGGVFASVLKSVLTGHEI